MSTVKLNIAIFGGSFDPVHNGHVSLVRDLVSQLDVDQVRVMPACIPAHKAKYMVSDVHRESMLELAFAAIPKCIIDRRELEYADVSYTIRSVKAIRQELGVEVSLHFVMGYDSLQTLDTWDEWQALFEQVNIIVARRPGFEDLQSCDLAQEVKERQVNLDVINQSLCGKIAFIENKQLPVSSSDIRQALINIKLMSQNQKDDALRLESSVLELQLPSAVAHYIKQHNLYT